MDNFSRECKKDPYLIRFKDSFKKGAYSIDLESKKTELFQLHSTRMIRNLEVSEVLSKNQKKMIKTSLQNQKYRSRCVEIKMQILKINSLLNSRIKKLSKYLNSQYQRQLRSSGYSSKTAQKEVIDGLFTKYVEYAEEMQSVIELADLIINDIDQTHWTLQHLKGVLELSTTRERNI